MDARTPVLTLEKVCKSFSGIPVLKDVDLKLFPGEVHCLVGENGAGKSTLIKIISGAYTADSGTYTLLGEQIQEFNPIAMIRKGITTIYQEIDVIPTLTVAENISLGNEPRRSDGSLDRKAMAAVARASLEQIGAGSIDINRPVGALKVANQQMVSIAKALHLQSRVIIFDEPSAVFSAREVQLLYSIIRRLRTQGLAVVYISHHFDEIFEIGDQVTVLKDGAVSAVGKISAFTHDTLVKAMVGRDIDLSYRDTSVSAGAEALRIENLSADGLFSDINITVRRGEIVGIAGLVGSGRTEIAQALLGLQKIQSGTVYINGNPRRFTSPKKALKSKVGMLPENRKEEGLVLNRSVEENGALCAIVTDSRAGYIPWRTISKRLRGILASLSVKYPHIDSEIRYLSGGNQQKVVLAKLLVTGCDIMILDEPTRGVDVGARKEMYLQMQQLRKQGKAMLMISSDLTEILSQSDRVYVMARGRVAGEFTHSEATEEKIMKLALNVPEGAV